MKNVYKLPSTTKKASRLIDSKSLQLTCLIVYTASTPFGLFIDNKSKDVVRIPILMNTLKRMAAVNLRWMTRELSSLPNFIWWERKLMHRKDITFSLFFNWLLKYDSIVSNQIRMICWIRRISIQMKFCLTFNDLCSSTFDFGSINMYAPDWNPSKRIISHFSVHSILNSYEQQKCVALLFFQLCSNRQFAVTAQTKKYDRQVATHIYSVALTQIHIPVSAKVKCWVWIWGAVLRHTMVSCL